MNLLTTTLDSTTPHVRCYLSERISKDKLDFSKPHMEEIPVPNPPLSAEEAAQVAKLSSADLETIDAAVFSCTHERWRKVAMVISLSMEELSLRYPGFSDVFYAERIRALVEVGRLESQGDLSYMRFSEVRRPDG